jgi:hypothetical protein
MGRNGGADKRAKGTKPEPLDHLTVDQIHFSDKYIELMAVLAQVLAEKWYFCGGFIIII